MMSLFERFKVRKPGKHERKADVCVCGGELTAIPGEKKDLYFCPGCNKLFYFLESDLEMPKIVPISMGRLKKK